MIYHFEINADHRRVISFIRANQMQVGLAVNPGTRLDEFQNLVESIDMVLFMAVIPGYYGSKFIPSVLDKIKGFRRRNPQKITGIDGGVKLSNLNDVKESGVDMICVGSAIMESPEPAKAFEEFRKITD
ncbi:MAG: hypothetical protein GF375_00860 [Candidatus Omnitrophica bacterium]|nr:hypothetical protein [Candidatus Omnitrophota bacterium]MBD3268697.1 hypothetical protein [Candidatus Omnitrophota bacterium]